MEKDKAITVQDVLDMDVLANAKVIAGRTGLGRAVTTVNVMEVPDIADWVSPGELLITTAFSFRNDVEALTQLIPVLDRAGVVGLGIKIKRYIDEVPPAAVEAADALGFPIFEIPRHVAFPDVITPVLTGIVNRQTETLEKVQDLHRAMTSIMLGGGDLREICGLLYRRFGNSVAINSSLFSSYTVMTSEDKHARLCRIIEEEKRLRYFDRLGMESTGSFRLTDEIGGEACSRIVIPILSDKIYYGSVYIWEDFEEISSLSLSLIESVTSLIALDMMKRLSILEMENNNRTSFLSDLLSNDRRQHQNAMLSARQYGFDPDSAHRVMMIRFRQGGNEDLAGKVLYQLKTNIVGILQRVVKGNSFRIIFANRDNNIVLLCESPPGEEVLRRQRLDAFVAQFHSQLRMEGLETYVVTGVGRSYLSPAELYKSLAEAKRATACPALMEHGTVFYEDMGVYRLLSYNSLRMEREMFAAEMLKPLLDYDYDKDAELVRTLSTYFKCRGNLTRLAEEMAVHYNTIVYRLQRIRDLTGFSLESEVDMLNLQIAIKIHEMGRHD